MASPNMVLPNDFSKLWRDAREDVLAAVERVGSSGRYVLGPEVESFESALASRWGLRYAVGVASGLDALEIALRALGCGPGEKVLTTPMSAFATALAVVKAGASPVFADVDESGLIDLGQCEDILKRDPSIRFFVPVHLYGHAASRSGLLSLKERFGVKIVEDCAQAIDAKSEGLPVGGVGEFAACSFYPTKNLGAIGDAGALLTNDAGLAAIARELRDYGQSSKYAHRRMGMNSRLDELHAAILRTAFLPRLDAWNRARQSAANAYMEGWAGEKLLPLPVPKGSESCWHLFPSRAMSGGAEAAIASLGAKGVAAGRHYPTAIPDQEAMASVRWEAPFGFERARALAREEVSLPMHPYLSPEDVRKVIESSRGL